MVRNKDGVIRIERVKSCRSALRQALKPAGVPEGSDHPSSNVEAEQPQPQPIVPPLESPSNAQAQPPQPNVPGPRRHQNVKTRLQEPIEPRPQSPQVGAQPHRPIVPRSRTRPNIAARRHPLRQYRRSPPPHRQAIPGQQVIERQEQQTRAPAAPAAHANSNPDWTLDEETMLADLMRDGLSNQDTANLLLRTVEDVAQRRVEIEAQNRTFERIYRDRQRAMEEIRNSRRPKNPLVTKKTPPAAPAVGPAVGPPAVAPAVVPAAAPAVAPIVAPSAAPAAQNQREGFVRSNSRKPANRNAVTVNAAPKTVAATVHPRRQHWVYVEDENEEAERRGRELQKARERLQYLRRSTISPVTSHYYTPATSPTAPQQRGRSVRSTSRKPANRIAVAVHAAPEPVPATVVLRRQPSPLASYRRERRRFATGSLSARLRPTHRYRSPTPQGHKDREQSTVQQPIRPAMVPTAAQEPVELPGNAPEPSRRVWTKGANGWESCDIRKIRTVGGASNFRTFCM